MQTFSLVLHLHALMHGHFPFLQLKLLELNPADHPHVMSLLYASVIIVSNTIFVTNIPCILSNLFSLMQVGLECFELLASTPFTDNLFTQHCIHSGTGQFHYDSEPSGNSYCLVLHCLEFDLFKGGTSKISLTVKESKEIWPVDWNSSVFNKSLKMAYVRLIICIMFLL